MDSPFCPEHVVDFTCNICGEKNSLQIKEFHRELAFCKKCGSTPRFRGVIKALDDVVCGRSLVPLSGWPKRKNIFGLGMSDWLGYSSFLESIFSYENTFYNREPMLDIQSVPEKRFGTLDYIISTDVFEHIMQPVQQAFNNVFKLLKVGGTFVFSVPYTRDLVTLEHYPDLHNFQIFSFFGKKILVNLDVKGRYRVYQNLVFHGGEGDTLEMRVFCESDILNYLNVAGFGNICVYDQPDFSIGYYWPPLESEHECIGHLHAYIISATKGKD